MADRRSSAVKAAFYPYTKIALCRFRRLTAISTATAVRVAATTGASMTHPLTAGGLVR